MKIKILGTRGSGPISHVSFSKYGGATSCYLVNCGDKNIFLDAGSGIIGADRFLHKDEEIFILISHFHIDHILGMPLFSPLYRNKVRANIYALYDVNMSAYSKLSRLMSPPLWPVGPEGFAEGVSYIEFKQEFSIGDVKISFIKSNHPGGSTIYKLEYNGKSLVYATDFEHGNKSEEELINLAKDVDLLMYDAGYTEAEYEKKRGWGHSTVEKAIEIGKKSNVKRLLLIHHDSSKNDEEMDRLSDIYDDIDGKWCSFARENEDIQI